MWHSLEFELSVLKILNVQKNTLPFAGIVLGAPSSSKTLGIELFREYKNVYYSDSFTPKAFVSHSTAVAKEELEGIDMLPRIKNKCLLAPELAPIFSKRDDEITDLLGTLTSVLDGHGYQSDSGAHGRRGYTGEYMFTMIGAAVNIPNRIYSKLSNLGPKLFFLRMPRSNKTDEDYIKMLNDDNFNEKKQAVQEVINDYFKWFDDYCPIYQNYNNSRLLKIPFERKINENEYKAILAIIVKLAKLLAHLRGTVNVENTGKTQGSNYGYSTPIKEEPDRAMTQLLNLAKGHALSQGKNYITLEDIPLLIKVVLSTASIERVMVFDLLLAHNGTITKSQLVNSLQMSPPTALRTMAELNILGLVSGNHFDTLEENEEYNYSRLQSVHDKRTNEKKTITLNKDFEWFLSEEFNQLREGFIPDGKSKYDDTRAKAAIEEEEESVKKIAPHTLQKKLFEERERQLTSPQTTQSQIAPALETSTQFPMLPLLHPILYLPLIEQQPQTRIKQNEDEEIPISIKDFNNSNNQDRLYDPPLIKDKTTDSRFNTHNKKALLQELA
jgi:hypothetical protein